ncbi:serine hydrolase domain-containing protein [Aquabacterium humicola]|uniref:serine hydrolase domain-containing protein n=1 Tax=Aquabacterium humicola TaxID=3237377 RepID=UPI0025434B3D|nr:serine hydrolase domain-containing protein [Rubrivivax pictus]
MPDRRFALACLLLGTAALAGTQPAAGLAPDRLARLTAFLDRTTAPGGYLGAVALIAREGRVLHRRAHGHRDLARQKPMGVDAIFRIRSMSKPIASAAVLMLMEEGRLGLDDPISRYLPAFASITLDGGGKPARPIAIRHLLTHTTGLLPGPDSSSLAEHADRVARTALAAEPGTRFGYDGVNTELASRIVELVSGQSFDRFVQQRILDPLRMADTGFEVPPAQRHRVVELTTMGADGRLQRVDEGHAAGAMQKPYASGAGGLYATAGDYARFAQMLLDGGVHEGRRLLARKTVELMMQNHLSTLPPPAIPDNPGLGFGLGGSVLVDPAAHGRLGSIGMFGWTGSATTWFTIDPTERLVAILLMQHLPRSVPNDLPRPYAAFQNLVYQSLM